MLRQSAQLHDLSEHAALDATFYEQDPVSRCLTPHDQCQQRGAVRGIPSREDHHAQTEGHVGVVNPTDVLNGEPNESLLNSC